MRLSESGFTQCAGGKAPMALLILSENAFWSFHFPKNTAFRSGGTIPPLPSRTFAILSSISPMSGASFWAFPEGSAPMAERNWSCIPAFLVWHRRP